ncbi:MAG: InlB B-repeat-containing protein, partial [Planctomycetota bacterium]
VEAGTCECPGGGGGPTRIAPPIYVEQGCTLYGWEPDDPNFWTWDCNDWDANMHNICEDPNFTNGYYLSQPVYGRDGYSPCVDAGSGQVDDPNIAMDAYTTRIDGVNDANIVDMGYHYDDGISRYYLTATVLGGHGSVEPNSLMIYEGEDNLITLTAIPECDRPNYCYKVKQWTGTDDDSSTARTNTVTLVADTHVTVEFELAARYELTVTVLPDPCDGLTHGSAEPNHMIIFEGDDNIINLTAVPECNYPDYCYGIKEWTGTDDDSSTDLTNTVTVVGDTEVTVQFEQLPKYELTVLAGPHGSVCVYDPYADPNAEPNCDNSEVTLWVFERDVVSLKAIADHGYRVQQWTGTDDDSSGLNTNIVTIQSSQTVSVTFGSPQTISVGPGGDYATIAEAVAAARSGDILIVDPGTYQGDIDFAGKQDITLVSKNPDDPNVVAVTIIDCQSSGRAFTFDNGEDANTVIAGFTIANGSLSGQSGGAIYIGSASSPTLANLVINDCAVTVGDGGAIYITGGSNPSISGVTINDCTVTGGSGGAIYIILYNQRLLRRRRLWRGSVLRQHLPAHI